VAHSWVSTIFTETCYAEKKAEYYWAKPACLHAGDNSWSDPEAIAARCVAGKLVLAVNNVVEVTNVMTMVQ
jgi:hypothetical protein